MKTDQAKLQKASEAAEHWPFMIEGSRLLDKTHIASYIPALEESLRDNYETLQLENDRFILVAESEVRAGESWYSSAHEASNGMTYAFLHEIWMEISYSRHYHERFEELPPHDGIRKSIFGMKELLLVAQEDKKLWHAIHEKIREISESIIFDSSESSRLQSLIKRERARVLQQLPNSDQSSPEITGGFERETIDMKALASFVVKRQKHKKEVANDIRCNVKTLRKSRCPQFCAAFEAWWSQQSEVRRGYKVSGKVDGEHWDKDPFEDE